MATVYCPLYGDAYYSYDINLDEEAFTLTFRWNSRLDYYVMDIQDAEEEYILQGVAVVPSYPLIEQYSLSELSGDFFLVPVDSNSLFEPIPDPRNMHETHFLIYESP
jgi:hypothetical protein